MLPPDAETRETAPVRQLLVTPTEAAKMPSMSLGAFLDSLAAKSFGG